MAEMFYKCFTARKTGVKHVKQKCKTSASKYNKEHTRMYVRKHLNIYDNNKDYLRPAQDC